MNKQKSNLLINYLVLVWAALAAYFAFTDLQISISVVNQNSGWAIFLQNFGEIPGLIVLYFAAIIFFTSYKTENWLKYYSFTIFVFLAAIYLSSRMATVIYHGVFGNYDLVIRYKMYIYLFFSLINSIIYFTLKEKNYSKKLIAFSRISILLGLYGYLFLVQPIKQLWGRVRFRDLDALYSDFTSWFIPNGINGNQSFPSGHAAMAWMILPILLIVVSKSKYIQIPMLILIISWGIAVSLSRVVIGAHYASDVLFGSFIIIVVFLVIVKSYRDPFNKVSM